MLINTLKNQGFWLITAPLIIPALLIFIPINDKISINLIYHLAFKEEIK